MRSDGKIEASSCKSLVWKDNLDEVLLTLFLFFVLLFSLFLSEKFHLVRLQLFLQSLQLNIVLENGLFVVLDLLFHTLNLPMLLL